jgi:hypothetical protein
MTVTTTEEHVDIEEFTTAYIEAMLSTTSDESEPNGGYPLDRNYDESDITPETMARIRADCNAFLNSPLGGRLIDIAQDLYNRGHWHPGFRGDIVEQAGHDFFLTRVGSGVGFWDGDWPKGIAEGLDKLSKEFGEVWFYVGDDGTIDGN